LLVIFTDGLVEVENGHGEEFGDEAIVRSCGSIPEAARTPL